MKGIELISVDMQYDFTRKGGNAYEIRPSVRFVLDEMTPCLRERDIRIHEIISDYRQPRPGDPREICIPGTWGYTSEIPDDLKDPDVWIKCLNSPSWTRKNAGIPGSCSEPPGPYHREFSRWLEGRAGPPGLNDIVLFGLTLDCCILCTAQDIRFRGYDVLILVEGTDTRSGDAAEKEYLLANPPLVYWAKPVGWAEVLGRRDDRARGSPGLR